MQFFLTGGGDFDFFKRVDQEFSQFLNGNDQVLLLPYASPQDTFAEILERVEETYSRTDARFFYKEQPEKLSHDDFEIVKALYIEGGNTFDLITSIRSANIETSSKEFFASPERVVYADSAGSIILGSSVRTAFFGDDADDDALRLQDYRGLDVLGGWSVHAHYEIDDDESVTDFMYNEGCPVLALHEETGIYISEDQKVRVLTEYPLTLFTFAGKIRVEKNEERQLTEFLG